MRYPSYGAASRPRRRPNPTLRLPRLGQAALGVGVLLEVVWLLRLLPAGVLVLLACLALPVVVLLLWQPLVTVTLVVLAVALRVDRHRRRRRAYEQALDDEIPF